MPVTTPLAGKLGLWVGDTSQALGNLHLIQGAGFDYLIVRVVSHTGGGAVTVPYEPHTLAQLVSDAATIGLPVFAWAYVYPSNITAQAQAIASALPANSGCTNLVLDAEVEWENTGESGAAMAGDLLHQIAVLTSHGVDMHLSSFCNPEAHPLPYTAFLAHCASLMPQSYQIGPTNPDVVMQRTVSQCPGLAAGSLGHALIPTVNTPTMLAHVAAAPSGDSWRFDGASVWLWDTMGDDIGVQGHISDWAEAIAAFHSAFDHSKNGG